MRAALRKGFLDWLRREGPDVLCLQETKARPEDLPAAGRDPEGYLAHWHWAEKGGYSGVATLSKPKPLRVSRGLGVPALDREGRVLTSVYPDFTLFNVYFPNGKLSPERLGFKLGFYEAFLGVLEESRRRGEDRLVICGDVNTAHREMDLARPRENRGVSGFLPEERAWIDRLLAAGFVDAFREFEKGPGHYTWWDLRTRARERNVGWRLDYFFVSESLKDRLRGAFILPEVMGSDHCPVGIELLCHATPARDKAYDSGAKVLPPLRGGGIRRGGDIAVSHWPPSPLSLARLLINNASFTPENPRNIAGASL